MELSKIKNIIFDLGGVILDIDVLKTIDGFRRIGLGEISDSGIDHSSISFLVKYETGKISTEVFRDELRNIAGKDLSDELIDSTWNAMLIGMDPEKIDLLIRLRSSYRLILLSNTNAMHEVTYNGMLKETTGIDNLRELFDYVYYSHRIHMRKPDREIFEFVLAEANLVPEETLYIDDSKIHIDSAVELGIVGYHLREDDSIIHIFA